VNEPIQGHHGKPGQIWGPPNRVNYAVAAFQSATTIRCQYQMLWDKFATKARDFQESQFAEELARIHFRASAILRQVEGVIAHWLKQHARIVLRSEWRSWALSNRAPAALFSTAESDVHDLLGEVFWFPDVGEEYILTLARMAATILHLIHCDILRHLPPDYAAAATALSAQEGMRLAANPAATERSLMAHRAAIVGHVKATVKNTPWLSQRQVCGMTPLCFTPPFYLARFAIARECEALRSEGAAVAGQLATCEALEGMCAKYIDWVGKQKIPLQVNFGQNWPRSSS